METKFNFKSQICTSIEQSRRLLELGLKKETADCCYYYYDGEYLIAFAEDAKYPADIPAWSLHRLIELIWGDGEHDMSLETHRPFEDCIERIDYMINQSHCFNKEYLE